MLEFTYTNRSKGRARRNRLRTEKKWRIPNLLSVLLLLVALVCLLLAILPALFRSAPWYGFLWPCGIALICLIVLRMILYNMSSHWLQDQVGERLWYEEGILFHSLKNVFYKGADYEQADVNSYVFLMAVPTIRDVIYDEASKRIEFHADGKGLHYADAKNSRIDRTWELKGYTAIFYDCYDPSLIEFLRSQNIPVTTQTIDFKIRDARI